MPLPSPSENARHGHHPGFWLGASLVAALVTATVSTMVRRGPDLPVVPNPATASAPTSSTRPSAVPTTPAPTTPAPTASTPTVPRRLAAGRYPDTWDGVHTGLTLGSVLHGTPQARPGTRVGYVWSSPQPHPTGSPLLAGAHLDHYLAPTWNDFADQSKPQHSLRWFQQNHPDWIVYRCKDGRPSRTPAGYGLGTPKPLNRVPLDWSNPEVQRYLVAEALAQLRRGFDGIAIDNVLFTNFQAVCGTHEWVDIGGRPSLAWKSLGYPSTNTSNPKLVRDLLGFYGFLSRELAKEFPGRTITANSSATRAGVPLEAFAAYFDGVLDEHGFMGPQQSRVTGAEWIAQVAEAEALAAMGKAYIGVAYANAGVPKVLTGAQREDLANWVIGNYLLVKGRASFTYLHRLAPGFVDLPEYHAPIGRPIGPRTLRGGVHARAYSGGLVLVNPSATATVTIPLGKPMRTSSGQVLTQAVLGPATARVLLNPTTQ